MIDLHIHTNLSDGTDSIEELLEKLHENDIQIFSITDHDNIDSFYQMQNYEKHIKNKGMQYIPGIEISTTFENENMHLIVYGYEKHHEVLQTISDNIKDLRLNRVRLLLEKLKNDYNRRFSDLEIEWLFNQHNPSKPHIAQLLVKNGYGDTIQSVFDKYLNYHFQDSKPPAINIVKTLSNAGLIVGIAHPLGGIGEKTVSEKTFIHNVSSLCQYGIKFLECYYSLYDEKQRNTIKNIALKYNLYLSGGSDYHGKNKNVLLGDTGQDYIQNITDFTILNILK